MLERALKLFTLIEVDSRLPHYCSAEGWFVFEFSMNQYQKSPKSIILLTPLKLNYHFFFNFPLIGGAKVLQQNSWLLNFPPLYIHNNLPTFTQIFFIPNRKKISSATRVGLRFIIYSLKEIKLPMTDKKQSIYYLRRSLFDIDRYRKYIQIIRLPFWKWEKRE